MVYHSAEYYDNMLQEAGLDGCKAVASPSTDLKPHTVEEKQLWDNLWAHNITISFGGWWANFDSCSLKGRLLALKYSHYPASSLAQHTMTGPG